MRGVRDGREKRGGGEREKGRGKQRWREGGCAKRGKKGVREIREGVGKG